MALALARRRLAREASRVARTLAPALGTVRCYQGTSEKGDAPKPVPLSKMKVSKGAVHSGGPCPALTRAPVPATGLLPGRQQRHLPGGAGGEVQVIAGRGGVVRWGRMLCGDPAARPAARQQRQLLSRGTNRSTECARQVLGPGVVLGAAGQGRAGRERAGSGRAPGSSTVREQGGWRKASGL